MAHVLVTGGTGVLGTAVVTELLARDHQVRVFSRSPWRVGSGDAAATGAPVAAGGDLATGAGIAEALADIETVVHCASDPRRAAAVDIEGTHRLLDAAKLSGGPHVIDISIVGCDRIPLSYYAAKTSAELAVVESGLPWTIQRTTQFHPLLLRIAFAMTRLPVVPVPRGVLDQPIDVRDVALRVAELVESGPAGRADDLGGPEVLSFERILRAVADALGRRRTFVGVPVPGKIAAGLRAGHHLATDHADGTRTLASYLTEFFGPSGDGRRGTTRLPYQGR